VSKVILNKPALILLYGFPGSGKTFVARQLCEDISAAHVQGDRIRYELFEEPRYDRQENDIVNHLMTYMAEEFLNAGISVVYDMNASRLGSRRILRDLARKSKADSLLVWVQIDTESAFSRVVKRDRRKTDDHYAMSLDRTTFEDLVAQMQNPGPAEEYLVISGKHNYQTQRNAIMKKLYDQGLISSDIASKVVKPGLVNLVPNPAAGRVDIARRNIIIR
jgi:predicted kinase